MKSPQQLSQEIIDIIKATGNYFVGNTSGMSNDGTVNVYHPKGYSVSAIAANPISSGEVIVFKVNDTWYAFGEQRSVIKENVLIQRKSRANNIEESSLVLAQYLSLSSDQTTYNLAVTGNGKVIKVFSVNYSAIYTEAPDNIYYFYTWLVRISKSKYVSILVYFGINHEGLLCQNIIYISNKGKLINSSSLDASYGTINGSTARDKIFYYYLGGGYFLTRLIPVNADGTGITGYLFKSADLDNQEVTEYSIVYNYHSNVIFPLEGGQLGDIIVDISYINYELQYIHNFYGQGLGERRFFSASSNNLSVAQTGYGYTLNQTIDCTYEFISTPSTQLSHGIENKNQIIYNYNSTSISLNTTGRFLISAEKPNSPIIELNDSSYNFTLVSRKQLKSADYSSYSTELIGGRNYFTYESDFSVEQYIGEKIIHSVTINDSNGQPQLFLVKGVISSIFYHPETREAQDSMIFPLDITITIDSLSPSPIDFEFQLDNGCFWNFYLSRIWLDITINYFYNYSVLTEQTLRIKSLHPHLLEYLQYEVFSVSFSIHGQFREGITFKKNKIYRLESKFAPDVQKKEKNYYISEWIIDSTGNINFKNFIKVPFSIKNQPYNNPIDRIGSYISNADHISKKFGYLSPTFFYSDGNDRNVSENDASYFS